MNGKQFNRQRKNKTVLAFLNRNKGKFVDSGKMVTKVDELETNVNLLDAVYGKQSTATVADVTSREYWLNLLVPQALAAAGAIFLYGEEIKDEHLKATGSITGSDLRYGAIEEITNKIRIIHDTAEPILMQLVDYKYTNLKWGSFNSAFDGFKATTGEAYDGMTQRVTATATLPEQLNKIDAIIDSIARFVQIMAPEEPEFAMEFEAANIVKDLGIRHEEEEPEENPEEEEVKPQ